jgi:hypothetical protein
LAQEQLTISLLNAGQLALSLDQRQFDTRSESGGIGAQFFVTCSVKADCGSAIIQIMPLQGESHAAKWLLAQRGTKSSVQLYQGQRLLAEGDATQVRWAIAPDVPLTLHLKVYSQQPLIAGAYRFRTQISLDPAH